MTGDLASPPRGWPSPPLGALPAPLWARDAWGFLPLRAVKVKPVKDLAAAGPPAAP